VAEGRYLPRDRESITEKDGRYACSSRTKSTEDPVVDLAPHLHRRHERRMRPRHHLTALDDPGQNERSPYRVACTRESSIQDARDDIFAFPRLDDEKGSPGPAKARHSTCQDAVAFSVLHGGGANGDRFDVDGVCFRAPSLRAAMARMPETVPIEYPRHHLRTTATPEASRALSRMKPGSNAIPGSSSMTTSSPFASYSCHGGRITTRSPIRCTSEVNLQAFAQSSSLSIVSLSSPPGVAPDATMHVSFFDRLRPEIAVGGDAYVRTTYSRSGSIEVVPVAITCTYGSSIATPSLNP